MKITICQSEYIAAHKDVDPKQLSKNTGLGIRTIKGILKKLQATVTATVVSATPPVIPNEPPTDTEADNPFRMKTGKLPGYVEKDGSVIMTPNRSSLDDEIYKEQSGFNKEFLETHKDHLHIMKPPQNDKQTN